MGSRAWTAGRAGAGAWWAAATVSPRHPTTRSRPTPPRLLPPPEAAAARTRSPTAACGKSPLRRVVVPLSLLLPVTTRHGRETHGDRTLNWQREFNLRRRAPAIVWWLLGWSCWAASGGGGGRRILLGRRCGGVEKKRGAARLQLSACALMGGVFLCRLDGRRRGHRSSFG
jgi:hypothetical protein